MVEIEVRRKMDKGMQAMAKPNIARRAGKQGLDIYEYLIKLLDRYEHRYSQFCPICKCLRYMTEFGNGERVTFVCPVCGAYEVG